MDTLPITTPTSAPEKPDAATANFDSLKRPFDSLKFKREFDSQGRWINARSGRKPSVPSAPVASAPAEAQAQVNFSDVMAAADAGGDKLAKMATNATAETLIGVIQAALVIIGEEEGVLDENEKTLLMGPLVRVLSKYKVGADALPAEMELAVGLSIVVITRLRRPKTATWFVKARSWVQEVWFRRQGSHLASGIARNVPSP